jgi:carbon-monoxide dehydrogenase medium subunit
VKPPPFSYHRARDGAHAVDLLSGLGPRARVLAGGQSLLPMLHLRLAAPAHLVDIGRAADLGGIRLDDGGLVVGAAVTQAAVERSAEARAVPLLAEAIAYVAHPPIRHRGTVVGSLAHASAVAELPCVAVALDAEFTLLGADGVRTVPAREFYTGPFATAAAPGELVAEVRFPVAGGRRGEAWSEFSVRRGNFPVAGAAAVVRLEGGTVTEAAVALCGVGDRPLRAPAAEEVLQGRAPTPELIADAAEAAVAALAPRADGDTAAHILPVAAAPTPDWTYRARVARAQVRRALTRAVHRAEEQA